MSAGLISIGPAGGLAGWWQRSAPITPASFYRPELDVLRFLAFFLVFVRHTGASIAGEMYEAGGWQAVLADLSMPGSYGVDVFFLLSAYLITDLLMREKERSGRLDIKAFYIRRILRIWPLYFFFLVSMIVLAQFTPVQFPPDAILPMLLFYGNWYLMTNPFFSPAGILWSISLEEQFYAGAPWAVRYLTRRRLVIAAIVLLVVASLARLVIFSVPTIANKAAWFCSFTRLDPIAVGIIVCLLLRGRVPSFAMASRALLIAAGAVTLYVAAVPLNGVADDHTLLEGMIAYPLGTLGALLIFLGFLGARLDWRPLVYLGQISFGLYVYHLLALNIAKEGLVHFTGECPFLWRGAIALPITLLLAMGSYAFLERPFLRLKERFVRAPGGAAGDGLAAARGPT